MRETASLASSFERQRLPAGLMQRLEMMQQLALQATASDGRKPQVPALPRLPRRGAQVIVLAWFSLGVLASGAAGVGALFGLRALEAGGTPLTWASVRGSLGATLARLGSGSRVGALGPRPERLLELYEFEGCPYCRKVREALSILDLPALIRPCPKGGTRFREEVRRRGGKAQFPYLVDPNAGKEMYESDAIVAHLFERYGAGPPPRYLAPNRERSGQGQAEPWPGLQA